MIEVAVRQLLLTDAGIEAACGLNIYPHEAPEDATDLPRIVYSRLAGVPSASLGERSGLVRATAELTLHAASVEELRTLAVLVRKRLDVGAQTSAGVNVQAIDVMDEQDEPGAAKGKDGSPVYTTRITAECWFRD